MLEQGPSKNSNLMEWDKLWAINKKNIDAFSNRYSAISQEKISKIFLTNFNSNNSDSTVVSCANHPQNPEMGNKIQFRS